MWLGTSFFKTLPWLTVLVNEKLLATLGASLELSRSFLYVMNHLLAGWTICHAGDTSIWDMLDTVSINIYTFDWFVINHFVCLYPLHVVWFTSKQWEVIREAHFCFPTDYTTQNSLAIFFARKRSTAISLKQSKNIHHFKSKTKKSTNRNYMGEKRYLDK